MKQKNGYTLPELLIVIAVVSIIALVAMIRVSYAFEEVNNTEEQENMTRHLVEQATLSYVKHKKDDFTKEDVTYIFAKEVAQAGYLFEKEEYNTMKVKITYDKSNDTFKAEVTE